jgi:hypothetical protein
LPLLTASLAVFALKVLPGKVLPLMVIAALALSAGGPFKSAEALQILESKQSKYIPLLQNIARTLRADETFVVCSGKRGSTGIKVGLISYFASNGRPFHLIPMNADFREALAGLEGAREINPPYKGLCSDKNFHKLKRFLANYEILEELHGYVYWKATGFNLVTRLHSDE